jgi:hypothetical protein
VGANEAETQATIAEVDGVGGLELPVPDFSELLESLHHALVTPVRALETERLHARVELELDVGREADEHELEVTPVYNAAVTAKAP